jgi:hypothetical protein
MRMFYDPAGRRAAGASRIADALRFYAEEGRKISEGGLDLGLPPVGVAELQRISRERGSGAGAQDKTLFIGGSARDVAGNEASGGQIRGRAAGEPGGNAGTESARGNPPGDAGFADSQLRTPNWRSLTDARRAPDPDLAEASRDADRAPEPASIDPERSQSALERAAAEADQMWRDLEPTLSDDERAHFNDILNAIDLEADQQAQMIREGAACLAMAVA